MPVIGVIAWLIVALLGILSGGRSSSQAVASSWLMHGDVAFVEYVGKRFKPQQVVAEVVRFIDRKYRYRRFVLIGNSIGGLLAYDVVQRLGRTAQAKVDLVVIDSPASPSDFQSPRKLLSRLACVLPVGPIWNSLSRFFMNRLIVPLMGYELDADLSELDKQLQQARSYQLSFYRDQLVFVASRAKLAAGNLDYVKQFVYVKSMPANFAAWPRTSRKAFKKIFETLREPNAAVKRG